MACPDGAPDRRAGELAARWSILAVLWLGACAPGGDKVPVYDLTARLGAAAVTTEVRSIGFDSPEDRRYLRSGWSRHERDGRGRGFAWGVGGASLVEIHLLAARDLELRLEGRPFRYPGAPRQVVTATVNGFRVAEIEMRPELSAYDLVLPGRHLVGGKNVLELAYGTSRSPRELGLSDDRRRLSVAWYRIRFGDGGDSETPRARREPGGPSELFVPYGTQIDYYLELEAASELRLDGWSLGGEPPGRLEIELEAEHEDPAPVAVLAGAGEPAVLTLPGEAPRTARLTLRALAPGEPGASGVTLLRPAVWAPARVPAAGTSAPIVSARPNVVLYLIDTLRADRLGCYGYGRPTSPRIDDFARGAALFEHAVAQSSWTRSSVASIFTGQWPYAHGVNGRSDRLSRAAGTLPELLHASGYRTAAFVTNPNVTAGFGFSQGFDDFTYMGEGAGSDAVHRAVARWLDDHATRPPFFLYVHTLDPHAPYAAPEPYLRRLAPGVAEASKRPGLLDDLQAGRLEVTASVRRDLGALYDAEVAFNDSSFGALLDDLEARGLGEDALIILLSDHGEELYEHGNWQHGRSLHGESIDVPLIVRLPGGAAGRRIGRRAQHVDLLPTVLDLLGLPAGPAVEGTSLLPLMRGSASAVDAPRAFSYLHLDGPARLSVHDGGWKLIQRRDHGRLTWPRLYRRPGDAGETENLAARFPIRTGYLAGLLREKLAADAYRLAAEEAEIDDDVRRGLEALGYLD